METNTDETLVERIARATEKGEIEWEATSSWLSFTTHFEDGFYLIEYCLGDTKLLLMDDDYDFAELKEFTNGEVLKYLYRLILDKYPDFREGAARCLERQREVEAENEHYRKTINITPELAESLDGRCFLDLDMNDRIEAFRFIKTGTGLDMLSIGCNDHWGYSHVHHDDYGEYEIDDTYNGIWIDMVNEKSFLVREIPQAKFDRANAIVNDVMDKAEKRESEFRKKQKEFGLFGEK